MVAITLFALVLSFPPALEPRLAEISGIAEGRKQEMLAVCYKYQKPARCDQAAGRARIAVVNDFAFPSGAAKYGLASGSYLNVRTIKVGLYNRFTTDNLDNCVDSPITRTRQQMFEYSKGDKFWLSHPHPYFCANPKDLLPALVHELCHFFGAKVGHVEGKANCQPVREVKHAA